jgi:hypothetical protein
MPSSPAISGAKAPSCAKPNVAAEAATYKDKSEATTYNDKSKAATYKDRYSPTKPALTHKDQ